MTQKQRQALLEKIEKEQNVEKKPSKKKKEVEKLTMKERIEGHLKDIEELEKEKATFKKSA